MSGISLGSLLSVVACGVASLALGLRGRRVGDVPYCGQCGYNLTGLTSGTCPECGAELSGDRVVQGLVRRSRRAIAVGAALLVIALPPLVLDLYGRVSGFSVLQWYPFDWVLAAADGGDSAALDELHRRLFLGATKPDQRSRAVAAGLVQQMQTPKSRAGQGWIDLLEEMRQAQFLTPAEEQQYHDQMHQVMFEVRRRARVGEELRCRIVYGANAPSSLQLTARLSDYQISIDGQVVDAHIGFLASWSLGSGGALGTILHKSELGVGHHTASFVARLDALDGSVDLKELFSDKTPSAWSKDIQLVCGFDLLRADAPDPVELVKSPRLAASIKKAIVIDGVRIERGWDPNFPLQAIAQAGICLDPNESNELPVDVAFACELRTHDHSYPLSSLAARAGTCSLKCGLSGPIPRFGDDVVDIVLTADRDVARESVDIFQAWDGPIDLQRHPRCARRISARTSR